MEGEGRGWKVGRVEDGEKRGKGCPFRAGELAWYACLERNCGLWDGRANQCALLMIGVGVSKLTARLGGEMCDLAGRLSEAIRSRGS